MSHLTRGDDDLHHDDGSHRGTAPTTNGRVLEQYERRIRRHLEQHADLDRPTVR
jgi:hypothetical protein